MSMNLHAVRALLPVQVHLIADLVGLPAAIRLVEVLGGTTWPVAKARNRAGEARHAALAEIIGEKAADRIAQHWGGDMLYIPRCAVALRRVRDLEINQRFEDGVRQGVSSNVLVAQLAREFRLCDRRIWEILKQPAESASGDLFD